MTLPALHNLATRADWDEDALRQLPEAAKAYVANVQQAAEGLTPGQRRVFECWLALSAERGHAPTYQEVGERLGVSKVTVYEHAANLMKRGLLRRTGYGTARAIVVPVGKVK